MKMACDVDSGATVAVTFQDISNSLLQDEDALDLYIEHQKDLRRSIVNQEFMVFHGNDPSRVSKARYLPPLPIQEKTKQTIATAWEIKNPAMRQLGNLSRRGPRQYLPGSATHRKPALISPELRRPHTAYASHVRGLINSRFDEKVRPKTTEGKIETMTFREKCKPMHIDPSLLIKPMKIPEPPPEELPETEPLLTAPAGGFRRPGRYRETPRKGQANKGTLYQNMEKKRLEDLGYLMKGNFNHLPPDIPTTVRIYLAGSKQDFLKERDVIAQEILPVLREFCENQGVELELVDMGTTKGDLINMSTHFSELDKCQRESLGPFYVLLQGDYCSPMHMLPEIPAVDFEALIKMTNELSVDNKHVLTDFYKKDTNSIPAKFIFQMDKLQNKEDFKILVNLWQNLLGIAEQASKFTTDKRRKYEARSVVELELVRIFQMFQKEAQGKFMGINCLCLYRSFQGLTEHLSQDTLLPNFTNIYEDEDSLTFDHQAQKRLIKLRDILKKYVPEENLKAYQLPWTGNGIDWENSDEHQSYLNSFTEDFIEGVKKLILNAKEQWKIKNKHGHLYGELLEHSRQGLFHVRAFSEREEELQRVHQYVQNPQMNASPFVVFGKSGVGKSAFAASLTKHFKEWLGKHCITVFRFLGITPKSEDLLKVLVSLCLQICAIYNMDSPPESDHDSINKMSRHFENTLELVSKHHAAKKPLVLLLDGLEKLKPDNRADTLFWLPQAVPKNVYLLLSVSSSSGVMHQRLLKRVNKDQVCLELGEVKESEVAGLVQGIMKSSHRLLTDNQKDAVVNICSAYRHPLFVRTLCSEAVRWNSDEVIAQHMLPQTAAETITKLLYKLEDDYGVKFVQKLMSFICILPCGMSEKELCDVMCSDQEILQLLIDEHSVKPNNSVIFDIIGRKIRSILKAVDLFVTKLYIHGRHLIRWNCDKYRETVMKRCFGTLNPFTGRNDAMDDTIKKVYDLFTAEKPLTLKVTVADEPDKCDFELKSPTMPYHLNAINCRKLMILPSLIASAGSEEDYSKKMKDTCLCYFSFLLAKLQAFHPNDLFSDFKHITEKDQEIETLKHFFDIAKLGIKTDPKTFALELLGCMPFLDEDYPLLNQLLVDAQNWVERIEGALLIVPVFPAFPSPLAMCKAKLWNLTDIFTIDETGRLGVMKNENGYIEIWDLENNEFLFNLGVRFDKVQPNVFTNKSKVLGLNGTELTVWNIETGIIVHQLDLESVFGAHFSSLSVFCCTNDLSLVTIHTSDEEFNQSLNIVNVSTAALVHRISEFDVKDEFFKDSAVFVHNGELRKMAFVMARSEVVNDKQNADFVKVKIFNTESLTVEQSFECGEKKFNKLLLKEDRYAVVSWKDCSFDIYDLYEGKLAWSLAAPDSRLVIEDCSLTEDNYLVGLTSSLPDVDRKYYALWFWNTDEQTSVNLLSQSYSKSEETPKKFVVIEELHVAVLGTPNSTNLSVWDLPNSECIYSSESHVGSLDNIVKAKDPYHIYSCSNNEEVIKQWDLCDVIRKAKEDKVHKRKSRARSGITDMSSVKSTTAEGILKKKKRRVLGKSKSVRFADEDISVFSEDVQSTKASEVSDDNFDIGGLPNGKDELTTSLGRDENVLSTQLETMVGATGISFAQDSSFLILASDRSLPTMWEMNNGHVIKRLEPHNDHDVATPWAELACEDQVVVGLTLDENNRDILPVMYKYQAWDLNSGEPIHRDSDLQFSSTVCTLNIDKNRAVICSVREEEDPPEDKSALVFRILDIKQHKVLQVASYLSPSIPTQLQLMDDYSYCVTDNMHKPGETSQGFMVYHLEVNTDEVGEPVPYEYAEGDKFKDYRATRNVVLPNGQLSLSTGLNGDMQVWDITSCEYEENLYSDPSVKDTRNPSLHNHNNKRVLHMVVSEDGTYLVCAGADGGTSVWDLENEINVFTYGGHSSEVIKAAISHDNQLILTTGNDQFLNVWKLGMVDHPLCRLYIHSLATHLHISGDNKSVAAIGQRRNQPAAFMLFQLKNAPESTEN